MVHVRINGPMREDNIRGLAGKESAHGVHLGFVCFCGAVDLTKEDRFGADYLAGRFALLGTDARRFVQRFVANPALAACQIDDGNRMPEQGVTS